MLERGGNAVDAAIATAAALAVVRPHMCGIGGDGMLLIYEAETSRVHALNAGGPAPAAADPERFPGGVPDRGPHIATVPGIVDGWGQALERFGTMTWHEVLQPALELARHGFPVYESLASWLRHYEAKYAADPVCAEVLLPRGAPPRVGELLVQSDLARSLEQLAKEGPRALYEGALAATYARYMREAGGLTTAEDLARYHAAWGEPVSGVYREHVIHTQPPMSQGWILVRALSELGPVDVRSLGPGTAGLVSALVDRVRACFDARDRVFGDPRFVPFTLDMVLTRDRADRPRVGTGGPAAPSIPRAGLGDTTALVVVDAHGDAVSMIQSLWIDAGVMIPGTGILVNGRLNSCPVAPGHPNAVRGGKIPVYTMHTYIVTRDGHLRIAGGTPGGNTQVQTNLQVLVSILDFGLSPQEAVEAARFAIGGALQTALQPTVYLEGRYARATQETLTAQGYEVAMLPEWAELELEGPSPMTVGSAKIVAVDPATGVLATGIDPRREAHAYVV